MSRFLYIAKTMLLCLTLSFAVAGISFTKTSAEDGATIVAPEKIYTYNETTGFWDSNDWYYDPILGNYQPVQPVVEVVDEVDEINIVPAISDPEIIPEQNISNDIDINNTIDSDATTGDAAVLTNTEAGSALSGDADSTATVLNNVNTVTNINGESGGVATFSADIVGDVSGDIILQPMISQTLDKPITPSDTITSLTNVTGITNNINLNATSGDATVKDNTKAGDAMTGSADAVANIINIVNSMVVAGQSFIGAINIYGNFIGDILISPDFVPQIVAANSGSETSPKTVVVSASDTIDIVNNLSLNAESGKALVSGNSQAGSAITGDALTNIVIFNMTGREIIANNCLLLFINVLGEWYGVIIDAPAGSTAAIIGNDIKSNTLLASNINMTTDNKVEIVNNVNLESQTGDASVIGNTEAGSAITGDATASVNLVNIVGSRFSLSGWFGLLFINVFGRWFGDFGIETIPPTPVVDDVVVPPVIEFIPNQNNTVGNSSAVSLGIARSDVDIQIPVVQEDIEPESEGVVLGATDKVKYVWMLPYIVAFLLAVLMSWLELIKFSKMRRIYNN